MLSDSSDPDGLKEIQENIQEVKIKEEPSKKNICARDLWPYLKKTTYKSEKTERRFVLYDLHTFSKLCAQKTPENRYVRIGGYVYVNAENIYLVSSRDSTDRIKVKIEYSSVEQYPEPGIFIEVFGRMEIEIKNQEHLPFVQMYFFRRLKGSYPEYVQLINMLKSL